MNEFVNVLKDIFTGALALSAIPGFLWFVISGANRRANKERDEHQG
jgi:hypothetical protein